MMQRAHFVTPLGRLVPTVGHELAFVPGPIPRRLDLGPEIVQRLALAENALGRLDGAARRLANPFLIASPLLHKEAILSNRIEGTFTTPEQLALLEAGSAGKGTPHHGDDDTREVGNYIRALHQGLRRLTKLPVCLRLIREVHRELLHGVRGQRERPGEFRTTQNWIGQPGRPLRDARFVPPPPNEMHKCLDDLESCLNEDWQEPGGVPLLIRLALVHYQFEAIHPFRDGNGRMGRLLIPLLLSSHRRMQEPLLYLSAFFERNRDQYMDLLLSVSQTSEWRWWLEFFLSAITESADESLDQAEKLMDLRDEYHAQFQTARSSALLQKLIDELFRVPAITIGEAAKLLKVTQASASSNLKKLERAGVLERAPDTSRPRIYLAPRILDFINLHTAA